MLRTDLHANGASRWPGRGEASETRASVKGARILIVEARYYDDIADALLAGAMKALEKRGRQVSNASASRARWKSRRAIAIAVDAAQQKRRPYDGVVALGCVIRGETIHFEIVSQEFARAA